MNRQSLQVVFAFGLVVAMCCAVSCSTCAEDEMPGLHSNDVELSSYLRVLHVSVLDGCDESGEGSSSLPWKTLQHALLHADNASSANRIAILVATGVYDEPTLAMKEYVDLYGGFNAVDWQRDIFKYGTTLTGSEDRRILIAADHTRLDGFILRHGLVRGRGAAIYCGGCSPTIANNRFFENCTKKPKDWSPEHLHEIAHDGGALYCSDGANPRIRHNMFALNRTEIGRGAAIAMHGRCAGEIAGCVFVNNTTGTEDTDRSSDGGAVSIFDWSSPRIENNLFLNNRSSNSNDGGALFVALWSSPIIDRNLFVGNHSADDGGALFIGGQEHRYESPKDVRPPSETFLVNVTKNVFLGNINKKQNSGGMRVTMEARAVLRDNVLAKDARLFVQNSEVEIANNTILDDTILREMPSSAASAFLANNVFWGRLETKSKRKRKVEEGPHPNNPKILGQQPRLVDEEQTFEVKASTFFPLRHVTEVQVAAVSLGENELVKRAVKLEHRWGVVKSNCASQLTIWGDVTQNSNLVVMPTFQVHPEVTRHEESAP